MACNAHDNINNWNETLVPCVIPYILPTSLLGPGIVGIALIYFRARHLRRQLNVSLVFNFVLFFYCLLVYRCISALVVFNLDF